MANWYQRKVLPKILNRTMSSADLESTRKSVIGKAAGVVLEIGAGAGHNLPIYGNISKLYALEPSNELRALAEAKAKNLSFPVEFLAVGAEHIPLPDKSVDTAVSTWTLCSVSDPLQVLKEIARILRPGGTFVFVDHGASPGTLTRSAQTVLTHLTKHFAGNCHLDRNIQTLIEDAGLHITEMSHPTELSRPLAYNYQGVAVVK